METLTEESEGEKAEETKQLQQPNFVVHLQQKIAQIRYGSICKHQGGGVRLLSHSTLHHCSQEFLKFLNHICGKEISNKNGLTMNHKVNQSGVCGSM